MHSTIQCAARGLEEEVGNRLVNRFAENRQDPYSDEVLTSYKYGPKTNTFQGRITINIKDDFAVSADDVNKAFLYPGNN